jgi:hypothetical protein
VEDRRHDAQYVPVTISLYTCDHLGHCFIQETRTVEYRKGLLDDRWEYGIEGKRPDGSLFIVKQVYVEESTSYTFPTLGLGC